MYAVIELVLMMAAPAFRWGRAACEIYSTAVLTGKAAS